MSDFAKIVIITPGSCGKVFSSRGVEKLFFEAPACGLIINSRSSNNIMHQCEYDVFVDGEVVEINREGFEYVKKHK